MNDLTVDSILAIHAMILARDGGDDRVISEGNLHQAVFQANLITDPFARAAALLYFLCAYKAFRDGNKRTARAVAETILSGEGFVLPAGDPRCTALIQGIEEYSVEAGDIEDFFRTACLHRQ